MGQGQTASDDVDGLRVGRPRVVGTLEERAQLGDRAVDDRPRLRLLGLGQRAVSTRRVHERSALPPYPVDQVAHLRPEGLPVEAAPRPAAGPTAGATRAAGAAGSARETFGPQMRDLVD